MLFNFFHIRGLMSSPIYFLLNASVCFYSLVFHTLRVDVMQDGRCLSNFSLLRNQKCSYHYLVTISLLLFCLFFFKFIFLDIYEILFYSFFSHHFTSLAFSQYNIINLLSDSSILFFICIYMITHLSLCKYM